MLKCYLPAPDMVNRTYGVASSEWLNNTRSDTLYELKLDIQISSSCLNRGTSNDGRKVYDETDARSYRRIKSNEEFWKSWKEQFEHCECHKYCLETYHVIECGYAIKCKPGYDNDLYQQLGNNTNVTVKSPFMTHGVYTASIINTLNEPNERRFMLGLLNEEHWELIDNGNHSAKYLYDYFKFIYQYIHNSSSISSSESMYNHNLVWQIIGSATTAASSRFSELAFKTGEIILDSSDETFKADGLIHLSGIELCLLETSGAFGIKDNNRFGEDHVKGTFGALTFLRNTLKTYYFATEDTLQELRVICVHARGEHIHLWSLEMATKDVQVLEHLSFVKFPVKSDEIENILDLGDFVWKLAECIQKTCVTIDKMKREHQSYVISCQLDPSNQQRRKKLSALVENEIQRPVKGSGYGVLLPQQLATNLTHM